MKKKNLLKKLETLPDKFQRLKEMLEVLKVEANQNQNQTINILGQLLDKINQQGDANRNYFMNIFIDVNQVCFQTIDANIQ